MFWHDPSVLVTGGASFIGSHLVDALVERGAQVRAIDDLSSGRVANIHGHVDAGSVELIRADLIDTDTVWRAASGMNIVFHLPADHGERGHENHAVIAMIAKAFIHQDPFEIRTAKRFAVTSPSV